MKTLCKMKSSVVIKEMLILNFNDIKYFKQKYQLSIVSKFCKMKLSVKTMRISNFNDNNFNQSDSNNSF